MLAWIAFGLLAAALVLFLNLQRQRKLGGLPAGELLLADHAQENCDVLVSYRYGLNAGEERPSRWSDDAAPSEIPARTPVWPARM
jgi:hypothetical protein